MDTLKQDLKTCDTELYDLIELEKKRQNEGLELIASENITSVSVMECLGSVLTNKYSEGYPGKRYYGGNEVIDKIENLCKKRALEAFRLNEEEWGINVQPYSGSSANFAVYSALLNPHDRIMGLDLPSGGHLTHGFYTHKKKVSASSIYFESLPYSVDDKGIINYDELELLANKFKPKIIICGYSAYSRDLDYKRFREIADANNSLLMCDMSHFSGFVATQELDNPFYYCDIVTSTTHKTLRGPRAGMIFCKKDYEKQINEAVFPSLQGGPHDNQIAAIATQLKQVCKPEFKKYIKKVKSNAKALSNELIKMDYKVCSGGTDNHIILIDLNNKNISGNKIEKLCELVNISINKNSVPGDKSAVSPGGIRLGTPTLTTRGLNETDMITVAKFLDEIIKFAQLIQIKINSLKLKDFINFIETDELTIEKINEIKNEVIKFSTKFDY
jgi:glycine hydroxymethyltransferase